MWLVPSRPVCILLAVPCTETADNFIVGDNFALRRCRLGFTQRGQHLDAIAHLKAAGVKFKMEPFPTPVCKMAFILDPDGNTICIHKRHAH